MAVPRERYFVVWFALSLSIFGSLMGDTDMALIELLLATYFYLGIRNDARAKRF